MSNAILKPGLAALGGVIGLLSVAGIAQDNGDIERKLRELNIMDNIFQAAMEQDVADRQYNFRRLGRPDSMYLAGQGMVFTFQMSHNRGFGIQGIGFGEEWVETLEETLSRTRESLELVRQSFPDMDIDFDPDVSVNFDYEDDDKAYFIRAGQAAAQMPQAPRMPRAPQVFFFNGGGPEWEAAQEMEEAMRETQEEIRDMQRDIRDLQRELRDDDADINALEANIVSIEDEMEAQMAQLNEQREAYETFQRDMYTARQEQRLAVADEVSSQLISTLCDYGGTLRTLGTNEHVTLILEEVTEDNDQVFVFDYSDINDCDSAEELKQNAVSYMIPNN